MMTEIVQIPVIRRNGVTLIQNSDLLNLKDSDLQDIARTVKGVVAYKKVRATYSEIEGSPLCNHYDCYNVGVDGTDDCGQHSKRR